MPDHRAPPWELLVESPDPGLVVSNLAAFRAAGLLVTVCGGPGFDPHECPVVRGETCPPMAGADVVLFDLDGDPPRRSETLAKTLAASRSKVLAAMRARRPELPVMVMSAGPTPASLTRGCTTIRPTTSTGGQISALQKTVLQ